MTVYVELDGVLLCGHLKILLSKLKVLDEENALKIVEGEYRKRSQIGLNRLLIRKLSTEKEKGRNFILWSERLEEHRQATKEQLGELWYLFHDHLFAPTKRPLEMIKSEWFCCRNGSCLIKPDLKKSKY